jgi:hypothetical protein
MKYRALRTLHGDYGLVHPGQVFEPVLTQRQLEVLEARGVIERVHERRPRAAIVQAFKAFSAAPENKAVEVAPDNKGIRQR